MNDDEKQHYRNAIRNRFAGSNAGILAEFERAWAVEDARAALDQRIVDRPNVQAQASHNCAPVSDPISPAHYQRGDLPVECIEVTTHMNFNRGNAIKYIWRAGLKGSETEDLRKAIRYLTFEVNRLEGRSPHAEIDEKGRE